MAALVAGIPLVQSQLRDVAVVGGIAVLVRLSAPHRATEDLDTLWRRRVGAPGGMELLSRTAGAAPEGPAGLSIPTARGPIHVDVLEAWEEHLEPPAEDPTDRLQTRAYLWAWDTATLMTIRAESAEATVRVAQPGPLVAMKLKACIDDRSKAKEATDVADILRLLGDRATLAPTDEQLRSTPPSLAHDIWLHAERKLIRESLRTQRVLREMNQSTDPEEIATAAELLRVALAHGSSR